jgi:Mg2+-importing ATPase
MLKPQSHFWQKPLDNLLKELNTQVIGLSSTESKKRLAQYGPNSLSSAPKRRALKAFLERFKNPLVLLLLVSAILVGCIKEYQSALLIALIVITSIFLDFIQEYKAFKSAELLKDSVATRTHTLRDQKPVEAEAKSLVPGDIVELTAGDLIPADGYVIEAKDFHVNQSSLTGESFPVEKISNENPKPPNTPTEASHIVLMGSSVISGWAKVLICETGNDTLISSLSQSLYEEKSPTSFLSNMNEFGIFLIRITIVLIFLVMMINFYSGRPWLDVILFSIALGVGMTPEFLPMIISVSIARGGIRLARQQIISKRLSSIYDFGRMDVLCTDKTGTLTEAQIHLEKSIDANDQGSERPFQLAYLNSYFETGLKSPLDQALLDYKDLSQMAKIWKKIDEVPFDSEHRRISVLLGNNQEQLLILKGPLEDVLNNCVSVEVSKTVKPLDLTTKETILANFLKLSQQGLRVLGVAYCSIPTHQSQITKNDEKNLIFSGLLTFFDPPRQDAGEVIQHLIKDGIKVKIVTGDNEHVTQALCKNLKIKVDGILTSSEIFSLNDQQLSHRLDKTTLFCRVTPDQKTRVIQLLKKNGHIVGFLGDGINDIGALHAADVSISVNTAVAIAKEAASFILLKRNLGVIHNAVIEGRRTFANIMKYIMMGTSSNLGNMISMVGASLFLPFLPMLPIQILLNNLLYDFSEIAIPFDRVDHEQLHQPSKWSISSIRNFMLFLGPISSLFDFGLFYVLIHYLHANESTFQTSWFISSLATQILVIFLIRTKKNPLKSHPHPYLLITTLSILSLGLFLPFSTLGNLFHFQPLPLVFYATIAAQVCLYLVITEVFKQIFYKKFKSE